MPFASLSDKQIIIIFGCGGHSRSVADIMLANDKEIQLLFVDKAAREDEKIFGFAVQPDFGFDETHTHLCFVGIGDNYERKLIFEKLTKNGSATIVSVISQRAYLGRHARIGKGCFVGNYCHVGPDARIGDDTILNNGSVVDHEVEIGAHSHIGPNATISGRSKIGDLVFIGVGATVIDKIKICSNVIVGAGATVVADITAPGTYIGVPARKVK